MTATRVFRYHWSLSSARVSAVLYALLLALWTPVFAQRVGSIPRIGYLGPFAPSSSAALIEAFRQGLGELGYVEGRNIFIDYRWAEGTPERLPVLAAELISLGVDLIVTQSNQAVVALQQATRTIPIVVVAMGDPVASGFVTSLARPGGNITGLSNLAEQLAGKWLDVLREAVPKLSRVAVLAVTETSAHRTFWAEIQMTARSLKVVAQRFEVAKPDDIDPIFRILVKDHPQGLIVLPHAVTFDRRIQITSLAAKYRLPGMYSASPYAEAGGLMSYGTSLTDLSRRAATYVDKILKGTKPGDIPVEQPTKFEFVINLKTAKQIGLNIPPNVLARADRVIK